MPKHEPEVEPGLEGEDIWINSPPDYAGRQRRAINGCLAALACGGAVVLVIYILLAIYGDRAGWVS